RPPAAIPLCFFFFQAEAGIRGFHVTGVQTCALPIYVVRHTLGPVQDPLARTGIDPEPARAEAALQDRQEIRARRLAEEGPRTQAIERPVRIRRHRGQEPRVRAREYVTHPAMSLDGGP